MLRQHAARSRPYSLDDPFETVRSIGSLQRDGLSEADVRGQLDARRWQRAGRAIVLHNGPLHPAERRVVALVNCGPRSVLTAFSAAQQYGLTGWERPWTDVLVPGGARVRRLPSVPVRIHYTGDWTAVSTRHPRRLDALAPALVRAAGTLQRARPACGLLAAAVQQRLVWPAMLADALDAAPRVRHRAVLAAAVQDVAQGAHALSEIDFARLCRRHGLPPPVRQAVRVERSGRRRYLDAEWRRRRDGRRVVAEVDGALHLIARNWWDDQMRQNEVVLGGDLVLRFPSVVLRCEEAVVVDQLRRALG